MKKLLMLGAILALGTTMAYGTDFSGDEKASGNVKVIAQITGDTFMITDLDGKDIVLDFGRVPSTLGDTVMKEAEEAYKITYVGSTAVTPSNKKLSFSIGEINKAGETQEVTLEHLDGNDSADPDTIKAHVYLDSYEKTLAGEEIEQGDIIHTGVVRGYMKGTDLKNEGNSGAGNTPATGHYQGGTTLTVTIGTGA